MPDKAKLAIETLEKSGAKVHTYEKEYGIDRPCDVVAAIADLNGTLFLVYGDGEQFDVTPDSGKELPF